MNDCISLRTVTIIKMLRGNVIWSESSKILLQQFLSNTALPHSEFWTYCQSVILLREVHNSLLENWKSRAILVKWGIMNWGGDAFLDYWNIAAGHWLSSKVPTRHFSSKNSAFTQAWYLSEWRIKDSNSCVHQIFEEAKERTKMKGLPSKPITWSMGVIS